MQHNVLFVGYGAGHIQTLLPIVKLIRADEQLSRVINPILLALTTARQDAKKGEVPFIGFSDLVDLQLDADALKLGRELAGPAKPNSVVPYEESVAYMGLSYRDLVGQYGEEGARDKFTSMGRAAFFPLAFAKRTLSKLSIDCVVTTNSPRAEHAFLEAARQSALPSLVIWSSLATHEISWVGQKNFSTFVCVDGQYAAEHMRNAGREENEIRITGNPQYDDLLWQTNQKDVADLRNSRGWSDNKKVLLFAQQNEPAVHPFSGEKGDEALPQKLNEAIITALENSNDNLRLCIRYHPNQMPLPVPSSVKISISDRSEDLNLLLHAVDGVFTCSSTVGYQAALIGKPVVQGMFSTISRDVPFNDMVGARVISDVSEFSGVWRDLEEGALPAPTLLALQQSPAAQNVAKLLQGLFVK